MGRERHKQELWLRAERAMGLESVPKKRIGRARAGRSDPPGAAGQPPRAAAPAGPAQAVSAPVQRANPPQPSARPMVASPSLLASLAPLTAEPLARADKIERLRALDETQVKGCTKCALCRSRTQTVFGEGDVDAAVMFIGEGPGETEDQTGRPFVGKAGQLLDKMIVAMGLTREQVFIANTVKCRPPGNRVPAPEEQSTCWPYLSEQIEVVRPKVIVTLGRTATAFLLETNSPMGRIRGNWHDFRGIPLIPTWHPAYVLRSYTPEVRGQVWSDLKQVVEKLKELGAS